MPKFSSTAPKMEDVFKTQPKPEIFQNLLIERRAQAIDILQNNFPEKIAHLQTMLKGENDPSSIFWVGRVEEPGFTEPKVLQPTEDAIAEYEKLRTNGSDAVMEDGAGREKRQVVLPKDIVARGVQAVQEDADESKGVRMGMHWFEIMEVNQVQSECLKVIVKELEDMHCLTQDLRLWLELEVPVIEDGNSFGAEVQNHLINQLTEAYKRSNAMQNGVRSHHSDRLKLALDWAKYPNFADYKAAIVASDRFDHFLVRSYLRNILMTYAGLLTKFEKNWAKVINPKGNTSTGGMY
ncbi:hypothetical protein IAT38_001022 [Cryptococcus sp. DSM 104549]